jgi:uncharacterized protein
VVISNSSPIILLHAVDELDILRDLYQEIFIPSVVMNEVFMSGHSRIQPEWIVEKPIKNVADPILTSYSLGKGEEEAIRLGLEVSSDLIILDDNKGRRVAKLYGLKITGLLGVLLIAKEEGVINKVEPILDKLLEVGYYISPKVVQTVLKMESD